MLEEQLKTDKAVIRSCPNTETKLVRKWEKMVTTMLAIRNRKKNTLAICMKKSADYATHAKKHAWRTT